MAIAIIKTIDKVESIFYINPNNAFKLMKRYGKNIRILTEEEANEWRKKKAEKERNRKNNREWIINKIKRDKEEARLNKQFIKDISDHDNNT